MPSPDFAHRGSLLAGVDGLSGDDIWTVGNVFPDDATSKTLIEHWDGSQWSQVAGSDPGPWNTLSDVVAISEDDVWAVGFYDDPSTNYPLTLTEHWDGTSWQVVPSPNEPDAPTNQLQSVVAISTNDVWAVGEYFRGSDYDAHPLVLHWDGSQWSVVPSFAPPHAGSYFTGVDALGSHLWAVGWIGYEEETLAERWTGTQWTKVATPSPGGQFNDLLGVSVNGSNDAWAVGGFDTSTLAIHWDGQAWTTVPTPNPGTWTNGLDAVKVLAPGDVWAVGVYLNQPDFHRRPLIEHWDGQGWSTATNTSGGNYGADLLDVAAVSPSELWAVGDRIVDRSDNTSTLVERICPVQVLDSGFEPESGRADQGTTVAWSIPASDAGVHTVTDASGMGLFDSGDREPGASFTFRFDTAGSYPIIDERTSGRYRLSIPTRAAPASGDLSTTFTVRWSSLDLQDGYVADVQIKRPGEASFSDWLVDQKVSEATFTPDLGAGIYAFRARLRNTENGGATGYSPSASILVAG